MYKRQCQELSNDRRFCQMAGRNDTPDRPNGCHPFLFQPAIIKAKQSSGKSGVVNKKTRFENNVLIKTYLKMCIRDSGSCVRMPLNRDPSA